MNNKLLILIGAGGVMLLLRTLSGLTISSLLWEHDSSGYITAYEFLMWIYYGGFLLGGLLGLFMEGKQIVKWGMTIWAAAFLLLIVPSFEVFYALAFILNLIRGAVAIGWMLWLFQAFSPNRNHLYLGAAAAYVLGHLLLGAIQLLTDSHGGQEFRFWLIWAIATAGTGVLTVTFWLLQSSKGQDEAISEHSEDKPLNHNRTPSYVFWQVGIILVLVMGYMVNQSFIGFGTVNHADFLDRLSGASWLIELIQGNSLSFLFFNSLGGMGLALFLLYVYSLRRRFPPISVLMGTSLLVNCLIHLVYQNWFATGPFPVAFYWGMIIVHGFLEGLITFYVFMRLLYLSPGRMGALAVGGLMFALIVLSWVSFPEWEGVIVFGGSALGMVLVGLGLYERKRGWD